MIARPYTGVFPVLPTPFTVQGDVDVVSLERAVDYLLDTPIGGLCILANWSEQFALDDTERDLITERVLARVRERKPVIVTTSHFSPRVTITRSQRAAAAGASMVMVTPPYHGILRPGLKAIAEFFRTLDAALSIPIMIQDAPISGIDLPGEWLVQLLQECPNILYFKIECPRAAVKIRQLVEQASAQIESVFDGEEAITLLPDLEAGATGSMPSALIPDLLAEVVSLFLNGQRQEAATRYQRLLPLLNIENKLGGIQPAKIALYEAGIIATDTLRPPLMALEPAVRSLLVEHLRQLHPQRFCARIS